MTASYWGSTAGGASTSAGWWVNRVGTAATVTTSGSVPDYGLALNLGTGPWGTDSSSFNAWAADAANKNATLQAKKQAAQQADQQAQATWFDKAMASVAGAAAAGIGRLKTLDFTPGWWDPKQYAADLQAGSGIVHAVENLPGIKQGVGAFNTANHYAAAFGALDRGIGGSQGPVYNYLLHKQGPLPAGMRTSGFGVGAYFDPGAWGVALRASSDQNVIDSILLGQLSGETSGQSNEADLDRIRKHSSLYQMTNFGVGLVLTAKFDPMAGVAKGIGEARAIRLGRLPRGYTSTTAAAETLRTVRSPRVISVGGDGAATVGTTAYRYRGFNPAGYYGAWRGKQIMKHWADVEKAARTLPWREFSHTPTFRDANTGGTNAAWAVYHAVRNGDQNLRDLGRRAILGDANAWVEIGLRQNATEHDLAPYVGEQPFLDAVTNARTRSVQMQSELDDLQRQVVKSDAEGTDLPGPDQAMWQEYNWVLHRDLEAKRRDLLDLRTKLARYDGYDQFLRSLPSIDPTSGEFSGPAIDLSRVDTNGGLAERLYQKTFQVNSNGKVHTVLGMGRGAWLRRANPADLHRADSGAETIRRLFQQYAHLLHYENTDGLNQALLDYQRAGDETARAEALRQVELTHGVAALAAHHGLSPEVVQAFLQHTRHNVDDMMNRLVSGDDSVYTTLDNSDGTTDVNIADGPDGLYTMKLPVSVTQLKNTYAPMDVRQLHLAIKHDPELFEDIDKTWLRHKSRAAAGKTFDWIDKYGSKWNRMWKPVQLFRLAWPQRVMMDEGFRSMAQLGLMRWAAETFPALLEATGSAVDKTVFAPIDFFRRRKINIGPGPVADEVLGKTFSLADDAETAAAPTVPESMFPKPARARSQALDDWLIAAKQDRAARFRYDANRREIAAGPRPDQAAEGEPPTAERRPGDSPLAQQIAAHLDDESAAPLLLDPTNARRTRTGFAVPVLSAPLTRSEPLDHQLADFIEANKLALSSPRYRLMVEHTPQGPRLSLVHHFTADQRREASQFAALTRTGQMWHFDNAPFLSKTGRPIPGTGSTVKEYVAEGEASNDLMEELRRQFAYGSDDASGGPEPAPSMPGFYATARRGSPAHMLRDARTNKRLQTLNLHREPSPEERQRLLDAFDEWATTLRQHAGSEDLTHYLGASLEDHLAQLRQMLSEQPTWFDMFQRLAADSRLDAGLAGWGFGPETRADLFLTNFLHDKMRVGALTHDGIHVGARGRQAYVFLRPEDLKISDGASGYHLLEVHLRRPDSTFNAVPLNRQPVVNRVTPRAAAREAARQPVAELPPVAQSVADARAQQAANQARLAAELDNVHGNFARRLLNRQQYGRGHIAVRTHDGKMAWVENAYEGVGEHLLPQVSSTPAMTRLRDGYTRQVGVYRRKALGYKPIQPPDVSAAGQVTVKGRRLIREYFGNWAELVNDQLRNDPIWYKMLQGEDDESIIHWLTSTSAGRQVRERVPHLGANPELWVEKHRDALNMYLPTEALQKTLAGRKLVPSDLMRSVSPEDLPTIYGPDLELISGNRGWGKEVTGVLNKIYHLLGTVPTDRLVRQPFAAGMYKMKMANLIAATDASELTPGALAGYEKIAREFALGQVRKTMYSLGSDSNFTQAVRFLAPFWGAQEEAITKWINIIVDHPEVLARFYAGQRYVFNHLVVINSQDQQVKSPGGWMHYDPTDRIVLQVPKWAQDHIPGLKEIGAGAVPISSLNVILQGESPLVPSLGPLVTLPADELLKHMYPDQGVHLESGWTGFFYKMFFPVGRPSSIWDQILPGWGRRLLQMNEGDLNLTAANAHFMIANEMAFDHQKRGLPPPTAAQVRAATNSLMKLKAVAANALPFSIQLMPKHQFYIDQYHQMERLYGSDAFQRFITKYGAEYARFAASSSTSLGIAPTGAGMADFVKYRALMAKFPDWASAMQSPDDWAGNFSSDAYHAQFNLSLTPGGADRLRTIQTPDQRQAEMNVRVGWLKYRQFMSAINAQLASEGLTDLRQSGAEDLAAKKAAFVNNLMAHNQDWANDYHTFSDTIYPKIKELSQWVGDHRFDNRPDIVGVRHYLLIRQAAAQALDQAAAAGGSRNLQSSANSALRAQFYDQVGQLIQANPAFGEFYSRWLTSDTLTRGSGP